MNFFQFDKKLLELADKAERQAQNAFAAVSETAAYNSEKVHYSFIHNKVSETDFIPTSGYGYDDRGRDKLDRVFADIFGAEDALVRHGLVSGTHALAVALFGVLRTGDTLVSLTGSPYDTLNEVIGITGQGNGSLKDYGVNYKEYNFLNGYTEQDISEAVKGAKAAFIQRSRGYGLREPLSVEQIGAISAAAKAANPDIIIIVDNCYGELVEKTEPTQHGGDLAVGSLIKNLGGAIARTGGYIAGRKDLIEQCAYRYTTPGIGKEAGATLGLTRELFLGLYYAPTAVENALKSSVFASCLFDEMGYEVFPPPLAPRYDIIAAIKLGDRERLIKFCRGIQAGSPVDSFVSPEPWAMPGYNDEVIMAAGTFTMGASIELSADAPLRPPYAVWIQGGINYTTAKIAILKAAGQLI